MLAGTQSYASLQVITSTLRLIKRFLAKQDDRLLQPNGGNNPSRSQRRRYKEAPN